MGQCKHISKNYLLQCKKIDTAIQYGSETGMQPKLDRDLDEMIETTCMEWWMCRARNAGIIVVTQHMDVLCNFNISRATTDDNCLLTLQYHQANLICGVIEIKNSGQETQSKIKTLTATKLTKSALRE